MLPRQGENVTGLFWKHLAQLERHRLATRHRGPFSRHPARNFREYLRGSIHTQDVRHGDGDRLMQPIVVPGWDHGRVRAEHALNSSGMEFAAENIDSIAAINR